MLRQFSPVSVCRSLGTRSLSLENNYDRQELRRLVLKDQEKAIEQAIDTKISQLTGEQWKQDNKAYVAFSFLNGGWYALSYGGLWFCTMGFLFPATIFIVGAAALPGYLVGTYPMYARLGKSGQWICGTLSFLWPLISMGLPVLLKY